MKVTQKVASLGDEGRKKLIKGALYIADAVEKTLGPGGQNYALEKGDRVTNDGLTIANELIGTQEDEIEERGARIMVQAIRKANDEAGDGSTTTTVLAKAILIAAQASKLKPVHLIQKLKNEVVEVIGKLKEAAKPIASEQEAIEVATVSVENEDLGKLIGKAQFELGPEGYILAEDSTDRACSIDRVNGLYLDNGFGSSAVINNPEKEALELRDVDIIYTNNTIAGLLPLKNVIEALVVKGRRQIVIMARGFTNEAVQECLQNQQQGIFIYPLNAPYTDQSEVMYDLEAVLGGKFINSEYASLDTIQVADVGFATHILAKRTSTVLAGKGEKVAERIETLKKKREASGSDFEKRTIGSRIAQLQNGFALLKIGAPTETERKFLKDKADDAVNAIRAAMQEGVIAGGGQALYRIAEELPDDYLLKEAIKAPYERLVYNMGGEYEVPDWVKDSVKVTRIALEKAGSTASVLATAGGGIAARKQSELDSLLRK